MRQLSIDEMQHLAVNRGGRCLSNNYINKDTKLMWECAKGHNWQATPGSIKRGHWCPYCAGTVRLTIEAMHQLAEKRSGRCLSSKYINDRTKLLWECAEGHQWEAVPGDIKAGHWCKICGHNKTAEKLSLNISEMHQLAKERGGKCLSSIYVNSKTNLLWECVKGHQWEAIPNNVKRGTWCPICIGKIRLSIDDFRRFAHNRGGRCLSNDYINKDTKLLWECAKGHNWQATPGSIKRGHWCPHCAGTARLSIKVMHQLAEKRSGRCLSSKYINDRTKLLWECAEGHQWKAVPGGIKSGRWCPVCGVQKRADSQRLDIIEMQQLAKERGGKCLSQSYQDNSTKLLWECAEGHQWEAVPRDIKSGRWCPVCSSGLGERICKVFFEALFGQIFFRDRPNWLVNKRGNQMELDGYCEALGLAFEHQGRQHYSTDTLFMGSQEDLKMRKEDDQLKKQLCRKNGVVLMQIPEIPIMIPINKVRDYIKNECIKERVGIPEDFDAKKVDLKEAFINVSARQTLQELHLIAQRNRGKCLSENYINSHAPMKWECGVGHIWEAPPYRILSGHWCKKCAVKKTAEKRKLDIIEMQQLAKERGGKCLSQTYKDNSTKLLWACAEGHQWEAVPSSIKSGRWCKKCADKKGAEKRRLDIIEMQQLAKERGGKCLSSIYINSKTKLSWVCVKGHQWEATPNNVKRGSWCPSCYRLQS